MSVHNAKTADEGAAESPIVLPLGVLTPVDAQGCVVNPCSLDAIESPWRSLVEEAVEVCTTSFGNALHALYLRGSVARATAVPGVSDLDLVLVLSVGVGTVDRVAVDRIIQTLRRHHPFCDGIDLKLISLRALLQLPASNTLRFLLKTQALCLQGADVTAAWPSVPLKDALMVLGALPASLTSVRRWLDDHADAPLSDVQRTCRWIMKKIVRAGFESVAMREQAYTRDLYPAWRAFSRHYPEQSQDMRQVLELALAPVADRERIEEGIQVGNLLAAG